MKKTFTISILLAVMTFVATTASAKSWRINNDATKNANFASINNAMSSNDVTDGDTLYLDPGCGLTDQTVSKQVTIVGLGYLRNDAPYSSATIGGTLSIKAANTKIEGVVISAVINIMAQNVTVERCNILNYTIIGYSKTNGQHATIRQCYIGGYIYGYGSGNAAYCGYSTIENNIIITSRGGYVSSGKLGVLSYLPYSMIRNNYIKQTYSNSNTTSYRGWVLNYITSGVIANNILLNVGSVPNDIFNALNNTTVNKNIMSCAEGTYSSIGENTYLNSTDESLVFALQGTNDQKYQLKADSPAKGYATDSGDCGPFGGTYPYVISGLPAGYPYYTKTVIGTRAKDGKINVSLNIKMQNE